MGKARAQTKVCATKSGHSPAGSRGGELGEGIESLLAVLADLEDVAVPRSSGQVAIAQVAAQFVAVIVERRTPPFLRKLQKGLATRVSARKRTGLSPNVENRSVRV